jgi:hypothetical protein
MMHFLQRSRIDRYFVRGLSPRAEQAMRQHVARCARCRRRYEANLAAEAALPGGALLAEQRLWQGITGAASAPDTARASLRARRFMLAGAFSAATLVAVVWFSPWRERQPGGLVERGSHEDEALHRTPSLQIFRRGEASVPEPVRDTIHGGDALMFAYSNPGRRYRFLMVFGVDDHRRIFWYYPAYERDVDAPRAIAIQAERLGVELGDAVTHALVEGGLRVYGLFLEDSATVSAIEMLVAHELAHQAGDSTKEAVFPVAGAFQVSRWVRVTR